MKIKTIRLRITLALPMALISLTSIPAFAFSSADFKKEFGARDGCFLVTDLSTGKMVAEFNAKRCSERFSPCSSFKVAAALMGFDKGVIKDENQIIKWDGVKRDRPELNQDQTPFSWMSNSAKWVTEWIMPQLGMETIHRFLTAFDYGNKDFSGGLKDAWVTSSLKISAREQSEFFRKFWKNELPISTKAVDLTKKIIFIKKLGTSSELYGKTGTGCLKGHECMEQAGKMLGWFVGVLKTGSGDYIFASNASDLVPQERPGGPRMRDTTIEILEKMGLVK
jgi:beta-lactamase class D